MNDFFVGRFLLLFNLISQAITQTFRYSIGSMHESREFQLMSGIKHFGTPAPSSWNTTKYNPAVFSGLHILIFIGLAVILCILQLVIMEHFKSSEFIPYETWLFEKLVIEIFAFRLFGPLGVIWGRRDFLLFIK